MQPTRRVMLGGAWLILHRYPTLARLARDDANGLARRDFEHGVVEGREDDRARNGRLRLTGRGGGMRESLLLSRPGGAIRATHLPASSRGLALSPNGRWLVYSSNPNFTDVSVRAVPDDPNARPPSGERQLASIPTPIEQMQWSADASEIFVLAGAAQPVLMTIPIVWTDGTPRPGALHKMFDAPRAASFATVDGRRTIGNISASRVFDAPRWTKRGWC